MKYEGTFYPEEVLHLILNQSATVNTMEHSGLKLSLISPFLVLHFSYYTLMTLLMIISVILLSMLMMLLSILSVIRHLICGNNLIWLLNLNLIYETLGSGKKWIVDFNAEKTHLVSFDWSDNNRLLRCWC